MHNRMTSRPRDPGRTTPAQGETSTPQKVPRLPHEHDLSSDSQARGEASGAGLGLAITQAIADSHGGRLVLENRTPRGLSAKLILP